MADRSDDRPAPPEDQLASVALLLSILGLLGCLPVGGAGVAIGYFSRDRIRSSDGALGGERTARLAIVIGWVAVAISVLALLAIVVAMAVLRST